MNIYTWILGRFSPSYIYTNIIFYLDVYPMNIYTWIQGRFSPNIDEFSIYCIDLQSLDTDRQPGDGFG